MFHIQLPSFCFFFSDICTPTIKISKPSWGSAANSGWFIMKFWLVASHRLLFIHLLFTFQKFCCPLLTSILIIPLFAVLRGYPICTALCHVSTEGVELHVCVSSPCTGEYQWRAILRTWWDALLFRKCWHGGDGLGRKGGTLRLEAHSFWWGRGDQGNSILVCQQVRENNICLMIKWESCILGLNEHQATQT